MRRLILSGYYMHAYTNWTPSPFSFEAAWRMTRARAAKLLILVVLVAASSPNARAQSKPQLFFGSEHVVVDPSDEHGRDYLARLTAGRPTPLEPKTSIEEGAGLGNVKVEVQGTNTSCGSKSSQRLVLCLDGEGSLSPSDRLSVLGFVSLPTEIYVATDKARQYLAELISHSPAATAKDSVHISTSPCTEPCARQIRLERRS